MSVENVSGVVMIGGSLRRMKIGLVACRALGHDILWIPVHFSEQIARLTDRAGSPDSTNSVSVRGILECERVVAVFDIEHTAHAQTR